MHDRHAWGMLPLRWARTVRPILHYLLIMSFFNPDGQQGMRRQGGSEIEPRRKSYNKGDLSVSRRGCVCVCIMPS